MYRTVLKIWVSETGAAEGPQNRPETVSANAHNHRKRKSPRQSAAVFAQADLPKN